MNFAMKIFLLSIALVLTGCASAPKGENLTKKDYEELDNAIGPWENPYKGDPKLAGVEIQQYPEGIGPKKRYEHKHPASIWYIFWNGNVKSVQYDPDGTVMVSSLWKRSYKTPADWYRVDFTYGSDPEFKRHKDPRK